MTYYRDGSKRNSGFDDFPTYKQLVCQYPITILNVVHLPQSSFVARKFPTNGLNCAVGGGFVNIGG